MATLTKWTNGVVLLFTPVLFFIPANLAFAETKVFVEEYIYQASEADSKLSSRAIALEQVKRLLLEKLGIYLESATEVKNLQITKDQVITLTAGIVRAEIIDEKWDGKVYILKAKIEADPKDVTSSIEKLRQDRQKTNELQEARQKAEDALKEVEKLKRELEIAKAGKLDLGRYNEAVNRLSATDWLMKGYVHSARAVASYENSQKILKRMKSLYEISAVTAKMLEEEQAKVDSAAAQLEQASKTAIEAYTSAISLNPNYAEAYYHRGLAYDKLGNHRHAVKDHETAANLGYKPAQEFLRSRGIMR